jgi:hypothetical protein
MRFTGTMTDLLKMDIFFVVATAATALVAAGLIVALVYTVRLLRTMNRVAENIEEEAEAIREDIKDARESVRGFRLGSLFSLFGKGVKRAKRKQSKK